mmetsp:Transcript_656/g.652  ORF Transcript_656/g.652 Transcript_656/m.652 type:complete len:110 (+) Transcript_656:85-414(+)|eukprot:Skav200313  [mRNA]  locus=scaffold414:41318:41647:- [translate_table: standard]
MGPIVFILALTSVPAYGEDQVKQLPGDSKASPANLPDDPKSTEAKTPEPETPAAKEIEAKQPESRASKQNVSPNPVSTTTFESKQVDPGKPFLRAMQQLKNEWLGLHLR